MLYRRAGKVQGEKTTALGKRRRNCYKAWRMLANVEAIIEAKGNKQYDEVSIA